MGHAEGKAQDAAITKEVAVATTLVDEFLSEIAKCCFITLMPGQHDPTNAMLPQKPLHPCILPLTSRYCANIHTDYSRYTFRLLNEQDKIIAQD